MDCWIDGLPDCWMAAGSTSSFVTSSTWTILKDITPLLLLLLLFISFIQRFFCECVRARVCVCVYVSVCECVIVRRGWHAALPFVVCYFNVGTGGGGGRRRRRRGWLFHLSKLVPLKSMLRPLLLWRHQWWRQPKDCPIGRSFLRMAYRWRHKSSTSFA